MEAFASPLKSVLGFQNRVDETDGPPQIHYMGWSAVWDEWLPDDSPRLRWTPTDASAAGRKGAVRTPCVPTSSRGAVSSCAAQTSETEGAVASVSSVKSTSGLSMARSLAKGNFERWLCSSDLTGLNSITGLERVGQQVRIRDRSLGPIRGVLDDYDATHGIYHISYLPLSRVHETEEIRQSLGAGRWIRLPNPDIDLLAAEESSRLRSRVRAPPSETKMTEFLEPAHRNLIGAPRTLVEQSLGPFHSMEKSGGEKDRAITSAGDRRNQPESVDKRRRQGARELIRHDNVELFDDSSLKESLRSQEGMSKSRNWIPDDETSWGSDDDFASAGECHRSSHPGPGQNLTLAGHFIQRTHFFHRRRARSDSSNILSLRFRKDSGVFRDFSKLVSPVMQSGLRRAYNAVSDDEKDQRSIRGLPENNLSARQDSRRYRSSIEGSWFLKKLCSDEIALDDPRSWLRTGILSDAFVAAKCVAIWQGQPLANSDIGDQNQSVTVLRGSKAWESILSSEYK